MFLLVLIDRKAVRKFVVLYEAIHHKERKERKGRRGRRRRIKLRNALKDAKKDKGLSEHSSGNFASFRVFSSF